MPTLAKENLVWGHFFSSIFLSALNLFFCSDWPQNATYPTLKLDNEIIIWAALHFQTIWQKVNPIHRASYMAFRVIQTCCLVDLKVYTKTKKMYLCLLVLVILCSHWLITNEPRAININYHYNYHLLQVVLVWLFHPLGVWMKVFTHS